MAILAIALAVGLGAWFLFGSSTMTSAEAIEPDATAEAPGEAPPGMIPESELLAMEALGPRTVGGLETRPAGGYEPFTKEFGDTGGTIVGEIRVEGAEYPESWTVTLEPSLAADGRDAAITKSFTAEPGMRTFELRDLPLAAYRLSASAPGLSTPKIEVALYRVEGRPALRGLDFVNVDLTLKPMARIEGFVRQSNGDAADDLAVYLTRYQLPGAKASKAELDLSGGSDGSGGSGARFEARTNASGSYAFESVPPGPWLVHVGSPLAPIVPAVPVAIETLDKRVDDIELPELAELELIVLDKLARPCPGVKVNGYLRGEGSGSFRAVTDGVGVLKLRYLTPGPWRVRVDDSEFDQKGQGDFVLQPGGRPDGRMEEIQVK